MKGWLRYNNSYIKGQLCMKVLKNAIKSMGVP